MISKHTIISSLDIGSRNIKSVIIDVDSDGVTRIIGHGQAKTEGFEQGVITDVNKISSAILDCVEQAEDKARLNVNSLVVSVAGCNVRTKMKRGGIPIGSSLHTRSRRTITRQDIKKVIKNASVVPLSTDLEKLHILPVSYAVDDQKAIRDPVRLSGTRLEADVMIITAYKAMLETMNEAIENAGLRIRDFTLAPLATGYAVARENEREKGVCVVDIGAEYTAVAIFRNSALQKLSVLTIGGNYVTNDIAYGLSVSFEEAENIKKEFGFCYPIYAKDAKIPGTHRINDSEQPVRLSAVMEIIQWRMADILEEISSVIKADGGEIPDGIVFTGGASQLQGLIPLAKNMLSFPVKVAVTSGLSDFGELAEKAEYSTAIGLVVHELKQRRQKKIEARDTMISRFYKKYFSWLDLIFLAV